MRAIISAGGTGGHIYPALAIINKIKEMEPDSTFLYIGTHNRMEKDIIPNYNIPYVPIEMYGFNRKNPFKNIKTLRCLIKANKRCKELIKDFNPDIVIGVGGYVTAPVIKQAKKLGYNTFIHEQNSIIGKANKYITKYADIVGVSFQSSLQFLPSSKAIYTGNPCSEEAIKTKPALKSEFGLTTNKKLVLIVMGSLGSSKINDFFINALNSFKSKDYEVLYVSGKSQYEDIKDKKFPANVKIVPYIEKMTRIMKKTDLIISRAGASTLAEITALQIPSILIPSPYVTDNHQYKNAMDLVNKNASDIILESDLEESLLIEKIDSIINNKEKCLEMKKNLTSFKVDNSALLIYNSIRKLIDRK